MTVRQCPRCELRFRDENETRQHLIDDHGVEPELLQPTGRLARGIRPHRDVPDPTERGTANAP